MPIKVALDAITGIAIVLTFRVVDDIEITIIAYAALEQIPFILALVPIPQALVLARGIVVGFGVRWCFTARAGVVIDASTLSAGTSSVCATVNRRAKVAHLGIFVLVGALSCVLGSRVAIW